MFYFYLVLWAKEFERTKYSHNINIHFISQGNALSVQVYLLCSEYKQMSCANYYTGSEPEYIAIKHLLFWVGAGRIVQACV